MGMSADAELVFGFVVDRKYDDDTYEYEDHPFWDEKEDGWYYEVADYLAAKEGFPDPYADIPDDYDGLGSYESWRSANPDWVKKRDAQWEAKKQLGEAAPVTFEHFGHYDNPESEPMIVAVKGASKFRGDCWTPTEIDIFDLTVSSEAVADAIEWCEAQGIEVSKPKWVLVASYG